jgi:hypothetical protein
LVEVKDFRAHRIENKQRLADGALSIEVGQKVRDSIACMIGILRQSTTREVLDAIAKSLIERRHTLKVVLVLEEDRNQRTIKPAKPKNSVINQQLKKKLKWLSHRVFVTSSIDIPSVVPDLTVRHLPKKPL